MMIAQSNFTYQIADVVPLPCSRCGVQAVEAYGLRCGCVELFCDACTEAPRYYGFVVPSTGCFYHGGAA